VRQFRPYARFGRRCERYESRGVVRFAGIVSAVTGRRARWRVHGRRSSGRRCSETPKHCAAGGSLGTPRFAASGTPVICGLRLCCPVHPPSGRNFVHLSLTARTAMGMRLPGGLATRPASQHLEAPAMRDDVIALFPANALSLPSGPISLGRWGPSRTGRSVGQSRTASDECSSKDQV
jgi:hypothetical protein